uniref:Uncharacterized protein n=1 Tax=Leersia perrieri TaxID=77586 RepID=A0A0D9UX02_9ORYZ
MGVAADISCSPVVLLFFSLTRISSSTSLAAAGEILASHSRKSASTSAASVSSPSRFIPLAITLYMYSSTSQPPTLTAASYTLHAARPLPFATNARTSRVSLYTSSSPSTNPRRLSFSSRNASTSAAARARDQWPWRWSSAMAARRSALRRRPRVEEAAAAVAAEDGERSEAVRRLRDCTARIASVERERPRWSGPRLSRGPHVMRPRAPRRGRAGWEVGVRCGRERRDAMGGGERRESGS